MHKLKQLKIKAIKIKDYSFFLGRIYFTSNNGLQNMFVHQPRFSTIKYGDTNIEYVIEWKSEGVNVTCLIPIKNGSLPNINYFKHGIEIQFNYTSLAASQTNYTIKIVNAYFVYDFLH